MSIIVPTAGYPLAWPHGVKRTGARWHAPFHEKRPGGGKGPKQTDDAARELLGQLRLIKGVKSIVISSNMPGDEEGLPWGRSTLRGNDPGVAAFWTVRIWRGGAEQLVPHVMCCDRWQRVADNFYALALSVEALRGMDRWGAVSQEQAFAGFAALPAGSGEEVNAAPAPARPWREVLGGSWPADLEAADALAIAKSRHRRLMQEHHPDAGGSHELATALNAALAAAETELTRGANAG